MQKKASYLLLTGAWLLLLLVALPSAQAAETTPPDQQTIETTKTPSPPPAVILPEKPNASGRNNEVQVEFEGHITPQIVSAIVPCNISFQMDPSEAFSLPTNDGATLTLNKVINPENAMVVNNSIWPIRLSVTAVEMSRPSEEPTVITLVNQLMPSANQILLVLGGKEPEISGMGNHVFKNQTQFLGQALLATNSTAPSPTFPLPILDVKAKETKNLWVYGKAATAVDQYDFTVTVTLRIDWMRKETTTATP